MTRKTRIRNELMQIVNNYGEERDRVIKSCNIIEDLFYKLRGQPLLLGEFSLQGEINFTLALLKGNESKLKFNSEIIWHNIYHELVFPIKGYASYKGRLEKNYYEYIEEPLKMKWNDKKYPREIRINMQSETYVIGDDKWKNKLQAVVGKKGIERFLVNDIGTRIGLEKYLLMSEVIDLESSLEIKKKVFERLYLDGESSLFMGKDQLQKALAMGLNKGDYECEPLPGVKIDVPGFLEGQIKIYDVIQNKSKGKGRSVSYDNSPIGPVYYTGGPIGFDMDGLPALD